MVIGFRFEFCSFPKAVISIKVKVTVFFCVDVVLSRSTNEEDDTVSLLSSSVGFVDGQSAHDYETMTTSSRAQFR